MTPKASAVRSWMRSTASRPPGAPVRPRRVGIELVEHRAGELRRQPLVAEGGEGHDADERALEGAHVDAHATGDQLEHGVVDVADVVVQHALAQDGHAGGEVRGLDRGDEPGLEAVAQAVLDRAEVAREAVGGQDELAAGVVQGVEGVEELVLGLGLRGEKLDVVDQQDVDVAVAVLEAVHVRRRAVRRRTRW